MPRAIECDDCGATVSAPDDAELVDALYEHHCHEHDERDRGDVEQLVAEQSHDA